MSIDLTDPTTFDQWKEQFTNALSGCAASSRQDTRGELLEQADWLAQEAVTLIQERAAERKPLT